MMQSSSESRSKRATNLGPALTPAQLRVQPGCTQTRSWIVGAALAWGLVAAQLVVSAAPVSAHSERAVTAEQPQRTAAKTADAQPPAFKTNPDTKATAAQAKAARAEKKKAARAAHAAKNKGDHDSTKVAKADKKQRASEDSIGTSDDPLEGL